MVGVAFPFSVFTVFSFNDNKSFDSKLTWPIRYISLMLFFLFLFCCPFVSHHICPRTSRALHCTVLCPFCPARGRLGRLPRRRFRGEKSEKLSRFCWLTCILQVESRSRAPDDTPACTPLWTKRQRKNKAEGTAVLPCYCNSPSANKLTRRKKILSVELPNNIIVSNQLLWLNYLITTRVMQPVCY